MFSIINSPQFGTQGFYRGGSLPRSGPQRKRSRPPQIMLPVFSYEPSTAIAVRQILSLCWQKSQGMVSSTKGGYWEAKGFNDISCIPLLQTLLWKTSYTSTGHLIPTTHSAIKATSLEILQSVQRQLASDTRAQPGLQKADLSSSVREEMEQLANPRLCFL